FFSSRRRHTRSKRDWSSDVCSSDLHYTASDPYSSPSSFRFSDSTLSSASFRILSHSEDNSTPLWYSLSDSSCETSSSSSCFTIFSRHCIFSSKVSVLFSVMVFARCYCGSGCPVGKPCVDRLGWGECAGLTDGVTIGRGE